MCYDSLFSSDARVNNTSKIDFENFLRAALQRNFFNLDVKIYRQIYGVVVKSPLGLPLRNVFLCFDEPIWINECPN